MKGTAELGFAPAELSEAVTAERRYRDLYAKDPSEALVYWKQYLSYLRDDGVDDAERTVLLWAAHVCVDRFAHELNDMGVLA